LEFFKKALKKKIFLIQVTQYFKKMPRENFVYKSGFQDFKMTRIDTRVRRNLEESDE